MSETCQELINKTFAYICSKTQMWRDDAFGAAIRSDAAHRLSQAIDSAALANDYTATAHACRAYWKHILWHMPQEKNYAGK